MTAAEYRAALAPRKPATPRTPPAQAKTPPAAPAPVIAPVMGLAGKQAQYYVGPYQLAVANGTHYPGRSRVVSIQVAGGLYEQQIKDRFRIVITGDLEDKDAILDAIKKALKIG